MKKYTLAGLPFIMLIAGLSLISADLIYIAAYAVSLTPDLLAVYSDRIRLMIEYIFASLLVLTGGTLLFDYEIKIRDTNK